MTETISIAIGVAASLAAIYGLWRKIILDRRRLAIESLAGAWEGDTRMTPGVVESFISLRKGKPDYNYRPVKLYVKAAWSGEVATMELAFADSSVGDGTRAHIHGLAKYWKTVPFPKRHVFLCSFEPGDWQSQEDLYWENIHSEIHIEPDKNRMTWFTTIASDMSCGYREYIPSPLGKAGFTVPTRFAMRKRTPTL